MAVTLPFDLQNEQEAVARKQALAQALLQGSLQAPQGQMVSGHFVGPGAAGVLAPIAKALLGNYKQGQVDTESAALRGKYNDALAKGVQGYFDQREGKAGQTLNDGTASALMNDNVQPQLSEPVKADPRKAAIMALTSGLGPLQKLGESDLGSMGKSTLTPKDLLGVSGASLQSRVAAALAGNPAQLAPEMKEHVVNNQIVSGTPGGQYKAGFDGRDKYGPVGPIGIGADGEPIAGQLALTTGKAAFAPKGVRVSVDTGSKAANKFAEGISEQRAKIVGTSYDKAKSAATALEALNSAGGDLASGVKSGIAGDVSLGLAKIGKALGMESDPTIANTEVFRANMSREVANMVKNFGSGTAISNADREFAEKAAGGQITLDDQSMLRLVNIAKVAAGNTIVDHHSMLSRQRDGSGAIGADLDTFNVPFSLEGGDGVGWKNGRFAIEGDAPASRPVQGPGSTRAPLTLDDYLKSKGVK